MAGAAQIKPTDYPRRSFHYRKLVEAGASLIELNGAAVANGYANATDEAATARRMGLADLSPLPRTGFKGPGTADWVAAQSVTVTAESNRIARQADGSTVLRLAPGELLIVSDLDGRGELVRKLNEAWQAAGVPPESPRGFPVPRQDSHAWFLVTGSKSAEMFAKVCGVDLRPSKFENGRIAQTSIARMNAVIARDDQGETLAYQVLFDSASAAYLWDALLDAMAEFNGGPIGLAAVHGLR